MDDITQVPCMVPLVGGIGSPQQVILPPLTHFLPPFCQKMLSINSLRKYIWNSSSVGLGTGLHTFILYLGPHIGDTSITISCIPIVTPEVLFLIFSFFFSCSNNGCIWMWYTWLPWASLPQYYSVPPGRPDCSFGPSMSWWIRQYCDFDVLSLAAYWWRWFCSLPVGSWGLGYHCKGSYSWKSWCTMPMWCF